MSHRSGKFIHHQIPYKYIISSDVPQRLQDYSAAKSKEAKSVERGSSVSDAVGMGIQQAGRQPNGKQNSQQIRVATKTSAEMEPQAYIDDNQTAVLQQSENEKDHLLSSTFRHRQLCKEQMQSYH
ncbi:hypothetical protein ACLOJK_017312 [Asimina triloba]